MSLSMFNNSLSGINAAMKNIQVIGHNVSNVDTPGYSRQQAIAINKAPVRTPYGSISIGQGVDIQSVTRIRNEFLDEEFRKTNENVGFYEIMQEGYTSIEKFFGEPSDASLGSTMNNFWNSLSELTKNPESIASRNVVLESAKQMLNEFKKINSSLDTLSKTFNSTLDSTVSSVNALTTQIHALNEEIINAEAFGAEASDLRDQRDVLIDQLSKLIDIDVNDDSRGAKSISVNGTLLVGEGIHKNISIERDNTTNKIDIVAGKPPIALDINNGKLAGTLDMLQNTIPNIKDKTNELISTMAEKINEVHKNGFGLDGTTGLDFFVSSDGAALTIDNIIINPIIINDPSKFAASSSDAFAGDNENLRDLLNLKEQALIEISPGVNVTFSDYYTNMITGIGIQSNSANRLLETYTNTSNVVDLNRMSVSGVSLDEELTSLSAYQHAYNANAQMIQTLNEMLDTLINII